jgi:hypothetical protein
MGRVVVGPDQLALRHVLTISAMRTRLGFQNRRPNGGPEIVVMGK